MLTLQRASAGSGKTYTLTKKFIRLLISTVDSDSSPRRLRTPSELRDSLSHILAVTFTNKATDEMKQRITGALNDLAYNIDPSRLGKTKYLLDFMEEFDATAEEISDLCKIALRELLISFSDFNVLTIDAFFQAILRTFSYEAELPDGYDLIVNGDYIARQVVFEMIDGLRSGKIDPSTKYWARLLIDNAAREGYRNWNIFNRKEGKGDYDSTDVLKSMYNMAMDLDKESNKRARQAIADYFNEGKDLLEGYKRSEAFFANKVIDSFARVNAAAEEVIKIAGQISSADISEYIYKGKTLANQIRKLASTDADPLKPQPYSGVNQDWNEANVWNSAVKKNKSLLAELQPGIGELTEALKELNIAYREWSAGLSDPSFGLWLKLKESFPRVGLMHDFYNRNEQFLLENGTMKLSDTNTILDRIISDDDVPFIYERYGSKFNHFLIDEFQDTSELQWKNFLPLLRESESHEFENLIIGDAKQSIYRFRSADPELITDKVPSEFPGLDLRGYTEEENTNRRSSRRIVEFNNSFFHNLSAQFGGRLETLYGNTVQKPGNNSDEGFVEITIYDGPAKVKDDGANGLSPVLLGEIARKIESLLERGYMQREIAVLVNATDTARKIISYLSDYNETGRKGKAPLAFVSEDSLALGSSEAVQQVVHCLRMIRNGMEGRFDDAADGDDEYKRINWLDVAAHFRYYAIHNPNIPFQDQIENFMEEEFPEDNMTNLIAEMQAVTLPSLVEALTNTFVNETRRNTEALYLAAFQDEVLAYCDVYPSDIASFLRWWDNTGKNISVVSPEGTDAISVMTIHKSKGLEFECVLLPDLDFSLKLSKNGEWVWIDIPSAFPIADYIPKMMPVKFTESKASDDFWSQTQYKTLYEDEIYFSKADKINKAYVAMTRPVSEMYIFLPGETKNDSGRQGFDRLGSALKEIIGNYGEYSGNVSSEKRDMLIDPALLSVEEESFRYGEPVRDVASSLRKRREERKAVHEERPIEEYFINPDREILKYHEEGLKPHLDAADDDRLDPRSEGSLLHAVLENVVTETDLDTAFEKMRVRGLMTRDDIAGFRPMLRQALDSVSSRGWFDGSKRVLTERALIKKGERMRRPDRVMVAPDGSMTVIDYKFGTNENKSLYRRQVLDYMNKLKEFSSAPKVEGFIWYVREGLVETVAESGKNR